LPEFNGCEKAGFRKQSGTTISVGATDLRKMIEFDDDTYAKLTQLGRDRMGTLQELADEAFADLLRKHGVPIDLKDALKRSAAHQESKSASKSASKKVRSAARKRRS